MIRLACTLLLAAAACGGSDDRVDAFLGTWTYAAGSTSTVDCDNDAGDSTEMLTTTFSISSGTESDLIIVADGRCAPLRFDVSGSTASLQAGQTCEIMDSGVTVSTTFNTGTATLDDAGTRITLDVNAAASVTGLITTTCTARVMGSATKTGN